MTKHGDQLIDLMVLTGCIELEHPDNLAKLRDLTEMEEGHCEPSRQPVFSLPAHYEVCWRCRGKGTHDHPAFSNGFTAEEMHEHGDDFREDYMAGVYDVTCMECRGKRVLLVPSRDAIKEGTAAHELLMALDSMEAAAAECEAEMAAERRAGA